MQLQQARCGCQVRAYLGPTVGLFSGEVEVGGLTAASKLARRTLPVHRCRSDDCDRALPARQGYERSHGIRCSPHSSDITPYACTLISRPQRVRPRPEVYLPVHRGLLYRLRH